MNIKDFTRKQYIMFGIVAALYILWVIWLGNFWWLFGLAIIFDMYLTKKVNWAFWKKRGRKNHAIIEWVDALIFALVAVTFINIFFFQNFNIPTSSMEKSLLVGDYLFVSKVNYGPRLPNTPLSFPLVQHTLPLTKDRNSFLTWIKKPFKRLGGLQPVKNNDPVVFNYPEGDTVSTVLQSNQSYYSAIRHDPDGREGLWSNESRYGRIVVRPVDKRENFIKRCIGIPGDSIEVRHNWVYVNGKPQDSVENLQFTYHVITDGTPINQKKLEMLNISEVSFSGGVYIMPLTEASRKEIGQFANVKYIERQEVPENETDPEVFPFDGRLGWNRDNYGPIWIPKKGASVDLTLDNLPLYERIIDVYENNDVEIRGNQILINGSPVSDYTFKMDYYWMMGDNRHNSADSRYWGFVPEDHIVGKPLFVYFSLDKLKKFPGNIRWKRILMGIH